MNAREITIVGLNKYNIKKWKLFKKGKEKKKLIDLKMKITDRKEIKV